MGDDTIQFLPFHAINEFMRDDFRLTVVRKTLANLNQLPERFRDPVNKLIRRTVNIPGFRNNEKAPAMVKVLPTAKAFEKNPDLVAAITAAWAETHAELRSQIFEVLKQRGWVFFPDDMLSPSDIPALKSEADWGILPVTADRTKLPGFLVYWPKGQTFEAIYDSFVSIYPDVEASIDEVSLMTVWLVNRLPYNITGEEEVEAEAQPSTTETDQSG